MHIAVNALLVHGAFSGVQHAILHQLRTLLNLDHSHRFTVVVARDVPIEEHLGNTRRLYSVIRAPFRGSQRMRRILWEQITLPKLLCEEDVELFYAPGYLNSLRWNGPSVVFIHDTIALSHPRLCTRVNALNYRLLLPPSARKATRVAVPSSASAADVARYCKVDPARIRVVPLGVEMPAAPSPEAIHAARVRLGVGEEPYLLAVSTIEPKKNFGNLIRWFDYWKSVGIPHHLVIIGKWGWGYGEVTHALSRSRHRQCIHLPGHWPQQDLPAAMAGADLLLTPSRYEGFGLPPLEAMAVGTPVVVSDGGSLPETVGEAGMVIPLDGVLWRAEIPTLLKHPERLEEMRQAGYTHAAAQTWQRTGEKLLEVFEEAGGTYESPFVLPE